MLSLCALSLCAAGTRAQADDTGAATPVAVHHMSRPFPGRFFGTQRVLGAALHLQLDLNAPQFAGEPPATTPVAAPDPRRARVQLQIERLRVERPSLAPPLSLLIAGAVASLVGGAMGVHAVAKGEGADLSAVAGVLMVGGVGVSTAGLIWWQWVRDWRGDAERREHFLRSTEGL